MTSHPLEEGQLNIAQYRYLRGVKNTDKKDKKITITS